MNSVPDSPEYCPECLKPMVLETRYLRSGVQVWKWVCRRRQFHRTDKYIYYYPSSSTQD